MKLNPGRVLAVIPVFILSVTLISGCKSDPATQPSPTPPPTDTTALRLTSSAADTIFTSTGSNFSIAFTVMKGGHPVDSAVIDFYDPIMKKQVQLGPLGASGGTVFYDTLPPQGIPFAVYQYTFYASKSTQKDSIRRYVKVDVDPIPLVLTIPTPASDTIYVRHGNAVAFSFHITHRGAPIDSSYVDFLNPLLSAQPVQVHFGPTINGTGDLSTSYTIGADVPAGKYVIPFIATRRNRFQSDSVRKTVWVIGSDSVTMGLRASSLGPTTIGLKWQRPATDKAADTVVAMAGSTEAARVIAPAGKSSVTLTGLTSGVVYSISVRGTLAFSETIQWATATRFGPIRLYENSDPDASHPNGIVLGTQATERVQKTGVTPNSDLFLATDTSGDSLLTLAAPAVDSLSHRTDGKKTDFSDFSIAAQSLDALTFGSDLSSRFTAGVNAYRVPPGESYLIFQARTTDQHYAQIQVVNQLDGSLVGTTAQGYHYVDLMISYQPVAGAPYAARGKNARGYERLRFGRSR